MRYPEISYYVANFHKFLVKMGDAMPQFMALFVGQG